MRRNFFTGSTTLPLTGQNFLYPVFNVTIEGLIASEFCNAVGILKKL